MSRRAFGLWVVAGLLAGGCSGSHDLAPVEYRSDSNAFADDEIELAAVNALGVPGANEPASEFAPIRLGPFRALETVPKFGRRRAARALLKQVEAWQQESGRDSLPPVLAALRIDPSSALGYAHAARMTSIRRQFDRARAFSRQGVRLDPKSAPLWALLADCDQRLGNNDAARAALGHALRLDAKTIHRGYETLVALEVQAGSYDRADSVAAGASEPVRSMLRDYTAGARARASGDPETARVAFRRAAEVPDAPVLFLLAWGQAEMDAADFTAAATACRRAVQRAPGEVPPLLALAAAQRAAGAPDSARVTLARAVALGSEDPAVQFNLAGAALESVARERSRARIADLRSDAEAAFSACIVAGYRTQECALRRAELRLLRGDAAAAMADARPLVADPVHATQARRIAARAALVYRDSPQVIELLAPHADSLDADASSWLGKAYLNLGKPRAAVTPFRRAVRLDAGETSHAVNLGIALSESGDLAGAEAVLRPLAAQHPNDPDVLHNLAAVLQRRGSRREASQLLRRESALRAP